MLLLPDTEIHLWLTFPDEIRSDRLLDEYRELLCADERRQEKRFHFTTHQHQYLITRALVRTVLSRYQRHSPQEWRFTTNEFGRPEIASKVTPATSLSFNVSHTLSLIVCGVALRRFIGVDTESAHTGRSHIQLADRYFSPAEARTLRSLPVQMISNRFLHYWTLKEAYIKARGMGLSIPMKQFGFEFPDAESVRIYFEPELEDDPARWKFWLLQISEEHLVAVCTASRGGSDLHLRTIATIPLREERPLQCVVLRESQ